MFYSEACTCGGLFIAFLEQVFFDFFPPFFFFYLEKCNVFACVPCNFTESPGGQEQFFFLLDL